METYMMPAHMGQYVQQHKPVINAHTIINQLYRPSFLFVQPTAIIIGTKEFPDVSMYQLEIDWDVMRSKTDAVIIREGQNSWIDPQFERNWYEARLREMYRGVYRFYDGRKSPGFQAEELVRHIENDLPEMEVIVDWEHNYGGDHEGLRNVVAMMERIEDLLPTVTVMLYTGYYFFVGNSNPITNAAQYKYLSTHLLHEAWYTDDYTEIKKVPPFPYIHLLQYGTPPRGHEFGCQSIEIDMNVINMTTPNFYEHYGGTVPPDPPDPTEPPDGGTMPRQYVRGTTTADDGLRVRAEPNTSSTILGKLPDNTPVEGWLENGWILIQYNGQDGYISDDYVSYTVVEPPEPPTTGTLPDWHVTFEAEGYPTTEITIKPLPTE